MADLAMYFIVGAIIGLIIGMIVAQETAKESVREAAVDIFEAGFKKGVEEVNKVNEQRKGQYGDCNYNSCDHCVSDSGSSRSGERTGRERE